MSKYILSEEAETDIEVIFDFGEYNLAIYKP
jgi:plasmid stabilization system protein ParE